MKPLQATCSGSPSRTSNLSPFSVSNPNLYQISFRPIARSESHQPLHVCSPFLVEVSTESLSLSLSLSLIPFFSFQLSHRVWIDRVCSRARYFFAPFPHRTLSLANTFCPNFSSELYTSGSSFNLCLHTGIIKYEYKVPYFWINFRRRLMKLMELVR